MRNRLRCNVRLTMLQHVTLEVTPAQVRACVAFWELLGFTEMEPPPLLRDRFTWVEREGTQIHLVPVDDPIAAREGHVAVLADDYDATLARLADARLRAPRGLERLERRARVHHRPGGPPHRGHVEAAAPALAVEGLRPRGRVGHDEGSARSGKPFAVGGDGLVRHAGALPTSLESTAFKRSTHSGAPERHPADSPVAARWMSSACRPSASCACPTGVSGSWPVSARTRSSRLETVWRCA